MEFAPGRRSVIGRLPGTGGGRSLMLYGHLDTVGVDGMDQPFAAEVREGRLHGRGAHDMKGGLTACLAAARALAISEALAGDLYVVAVADEETESRGMQQVLEQLHTDGAIVTEATELDLGVAHKGFCWIEVVTEGRAAHGSRPEEGCDANTLMGRVLVALEQETTRIASGRRHPLVGTGSQHVGTIHGGSGPSIYAARCRIEVERRLIPGETAEVAVEDVNRLLTTLGAADPRFRATARLLLERPSFEQDPDSPLARAVHRAATAVRGQAPAVIGHSYWMDASLLKAAGVETVVIGPAGAGAHADLEYVELDSVGQLADILVRSAQAYCQIDTG
jgi:acetylornithine deacetylase